MAPPTSAARPKRAAEAFHRGGAQDPRNDSDSNDYRSGRQGSDPARRKKPRFDPRNPSTLAADARDAEEDLILNADVIGKTGAGVKRNAVNIDGYDSDSENDNFDARAAERAKEKKQKQQTEAAGAGKSALEEEDDMFADLKAEQDGNRTAGEGEEEGGGKKRKKDVRFMAQGEIEGQVMSSTSGGKVSSDLLLGGGGGSGGANGRGKQRVQEQESESSSDEEERDQLPDEMEDDLAAEVGAGGKKKHAPRLDAFNLKQEEEEGRYDESGNYVRKAADPDASNDNWLEGLSKKDMKRAKEAHDRREDEQRRKAIEDDAVLTSDLLSTLIQHLETGETALEALQRLNKRNNKERKVPKWKLKKQQKDQMDVDDAAMNNHKPAQDSADMARQQSVSEITAAADALYSRGQHEIYDAEREILMRQYRRETGDDWQPEKNAELSNNDAASQRWEYRWSDARDGGEVHGPYDIPTMKAWNEAGYFGEGVEFRPVNGEGWSRILDVS